MASIRTNLGEVKRGEVYYISYDDGFGSEIRTGRPAVIVSNDEENVRAAVVTVVFLTTATKYGEVNVEIYSTSRQSWAMCNQIKVVDKARLGDRMCILTTAEMAKIDEGICAALDLPVVKTNPEREKELEALRKSVADATTEIEVLKRAYERVLDKLVETRIATDMAARVAAPVEEPVVQPEVAPVEEPWQVDINRASFVKLRELNFSDNICCAIISNRPYMSTEDLKKVPGVTSIAWNLVKNKITTGDTAEYRIKPRSSNKISVNTATAAELKEFTGMGMRAANSIVRYRKAVGRIESVEDLLKSDDFGQVAMNRYGSMLTV